MELRNSIAARFELDLPATLMFDHPSVSALAAYLASRLLVAAPAAHQGDMQLVARPALHLSQAADAAEVTAVVGVSARFPGGVSSLPSFWEAATRGADLQREVPLDRWDVEAGYHPSTTPQGMTIYARFGAFCSGKLRGRSATCVRSLATSTSVATPCG